MKKLILFIFLFLLLPFPAIAQTGEGNIPASGYVIEDFRSEIFVNKDTSLTVKETIKTNFFIYKHGIFRNIPVTYSAHGKTIQARFSVNSVTDENGSPYQYQVSGFGQSKQIKIGDPNKTITGPQTYVISYTIKKVLLPYTDHDEIYWNVTGHEWDTIINSTSTTITSRFATITKVDCFAGIFGSTEKNCTQNYTGQSANFTATTALGDGKDFTIVVALDKNNQLVFPGQSEQLIELVADNWGYPVALIPLLFIFLAWYSKGRDLRYLSENVYYKPDDGKTRTTSIFEREHLPLVYSPINGLTPSEVGTIIDEKVDIEDVISEIVELGRLGYLQIVKVEKKKFLGSSTDFVFVKKDKDTAPLKEYQKYLLEKIFAIDMDMDALGKILAYDMPAESKAILKKILSGEETSSSVTLSSLKYKFYKYLQGFKDLLYQDMADQHYFDGNPETVKGKWIGLYFLVAFFTTFILMIFINQTDNPTPLILGAFLLIPSFIFLMKMPRRTAWGHSLYRQIQGLKFYINEGKWREEISEKHLFLEEILPLAVCLGVVNKLAADMAALGVPPPSYMTGTTSSSFLRDYSTFYILSNTNMLAAPSSSGSSWSGHSSWSGGSGFGGGSSGGGFGGGGGGSW